MFAMKIISMPTEIVLFYIQAESFPKGVKDAFLKLESLLPTRRGRKFYGIYEEQDGQVIYRAAVEELYPGEAEKYNCKYYFLKPGDYLSITLSNWEKHLEKIEVAFDRLAESPTVDPQSPSVEFYKSSKELICMMRLNAEPTDK
ncbi:MAG: transcriptional regulator [Bacteroidetes bacterium]|nr:MAG: transcriptional regulator [Bacteroidota bacterium]